MAGNAADPGRTVTSKVVAVLTTFIDGGVHSVTEIARLTGMSSATTHRLVTEMTRHGLLVRDDKFSYRVGPALHALGGATREPSSIAECARRIVEDLSYALRTHVRLGVLYNLEVAYIEKSPGHQPVTWFSPSACLPAHATALGKALLAFSEPTLMKEVIAEGLKPYTPCTVTSPDRFRRELIGTRLRGLAINCHEFDPQTAALAVPILGPGGHAVAALSARARNLDTDLHDMEPALRVAGRTLSRQLMGFGVLRGEPNRSHARQDVVAGVNGARTNILASPSRRGRPRRS